jgi:predicted RNA methylase
VSPRVPFQRIEGDAYYTPDDVAAACVRAIAPRLLAGDPPLIIEPSAGGGAFIRAVNAIGLDDTYAIDINGDAAGLGLATTYSVGDFAMLDIEPPACRTWVIGNPPYSHAQRHVERARSRSRCRSAASLAVSRSCCGSPCLKARAARRSGAPTRQPRFTF